MKFKIHIKFIIFFLIAVTLFSCASKKTIVYLQSSGNEQESATGIANYEPVLQPDDVLMIVVSAENPEVAVPYNLRPLSFQSNIGEVGISYLVDSNGEIDFPLLGKIKLSGMSRIKAVEKIKNLLANHIKDPIVNLRILNFKISVLGEVKNPGVHTIQSERITLLEALSLSGDMTIYGKRNAVLIIREKDGIKTIEKVDITKKDFINSPYYYLTQNDVVYIEPNKTKINSSVVGPNIAIGFSAISLIITIIALTTR